MDPISRWNPGWRGRRARLLGRGRWRTQERSWSGNTPRSALSHIDAQSRELEEQLEKLRDRLTEASSSEGENWRSNEQEDVTECQYQVRLARKKG